MMPVFVWHVESRVDGGTREVVMKPKLCGDNILGDCDSSNCSYAYWSELQRTVAAIFCARTRLNSSPTSLVSVP